MLFAVVGLAVCVVVAVAGTIWGSILMDIEVDEEQGKDKKYGNGNADRYSDSGVVGDTMRRSADGTEIGEIRWGLVGEDVRRFYGEGEHGRRLILACILEGVEN